MEFPAADSATGPDGVRLRPLTGYDAEAVLSAFTGDPTMARQGDIGDLDSAHRYIATLTDQDEGNLAVALDSGGRCTGVVAINGTREHRFGWFFYWRHRDHRGDGAMSAAARTVADWALRPKPDGGGFERLELGHRENNPASGRIARAAGFVLEGRERAKFLVDGERIDVLTYGRLRSDP